MSNGDLNWIANFIWGIADDVLRDLYVRGKYRDVILPMTVLRRLDALLEPTKKAVLDMKTSLDKAKIVHQDQALRQAAGQAFYNTSKFTMRDLKARASQQQLKADFEAYLDGFSPNVQDILEKFEFRNQIPRLSKADALGTLINKLLSPDINLSPNPVKNNDGSVKHPGLDNHAMGTIFEELVRRFNEENNEEAGEHWTPRDAVKLMAKLIFLPIASHPGGGTDQHRPRTRCVGLDAGGFGHTRFDRCDLGAGTLRDLQALVSYERHRRRWQRGCCRWVECHSQGAHFRHGHSLGNSRARAALRSGAGRRDGTRP